MGLNSKPHKSQPINKNNNKYKANDVSVINKGKKNTRKKPLVK
jgi:hypothetical protein